MSGDLLLERSGAGLCASFVRPWAIGYLLVQGFAMAPTVNDWVPSVWSPSGCNLPTEKENVTQVACFAVDVDMSSSPLEIHHRSTLTACELRPKQRRTDVFIHIFSFATVHLGRAQRLEQLLNFQSDGSEKSPG